MKFVKRSRGFTLVELLVVIAIIAVLAGLISVAAVRAVTAAQQTRIKAEVAQLDTAFKAFKQKYGAYPPCDLRLTVTSGSYPNPALRAFVARAFPRYRQGDSSNPVKFLMADLQVAGLDISETHVDSDVALAFWLSGFNPDVTSPFAATTGTTSPTAYTGTREAFFDFDKTRLMIHAENAMPSATATSATQPGSLVYVPPGGAKVPYHYFDSRSYTSDATQTQPGTPTVYTETIPNSVIGYPMPYALDVNNNQVNDSFASTPVLNVDTWANPDSFQIISAGLDGNFGGALSSAQPKLFPVGVNYTQEDNDNITNFNAKATLEDDKP